MTKDTGPVLVSWVAVNNDPFERERNRRDYRKIGTDLVPGPTMTLLFDQDSPYRNEIRDVVLFHRHDPDGSDDLESMVVSQTMDAIKERCADMTVRTEVWKGRDPTDHKAIFEFLRPKMIELRGKYPGRLLLIHVSPGTPSMHTIWVLMVETGFIDPPVQLVKSYRRTERRGRPAVVPVEVGLETFYKAYKASKPLHVSSDAEFVFWDPARFQSEALKSLFAEARRFAHLNVPVLLMGERGTGKTTLATWIRQHSPYRRREQDAHWPAVPCGQYSPETMRAELFGYRKGAFTDAREDRDGLLAAADGDTLFLDEIGDISRELQRLLIKAVEEKQYVRLGDVRTRKSDFRLITATNLSWSRLQERLDGDFLDRISPLTLSFPPLRTLGEDLPWLWEGVYAITSQRSGAEQNRVQLTSAHHKRIVAKLASSPLPGNLRDLFRIAYRVQAALGDPHAPLPPDDALTYGLDGLTAGVDGEMSTTDLPRAIARRFADSSPLDDLLGPGIKIPTAAVESEIKRFIAGEVRRLSRERRLPAGALCDVSDRALRTWATTQVRKKSSGTRKNPSSY
jgi:sigma54-dependent transcription regulator